MDVVKKIVKKILRTIKDTKSKVFSYFGANKRLMKNYTFALESLEKQDISKFEQIMVVAHPDDELIFGGEVLINDKKTLVICLTNNKGVRHKNLVRVSEETNCELIHLGFTDVENGYDYLWNKTKVYIENFFEKLKMSVENQKIITHNFEGEYFHPHHILINDMMTKVFSDYDNLYHFSLKRENEIENLELYNKKMEISKLYTSKQKTFTLDYIVEYLKKGTIVKNNTHMRYKNDENKNK